MKRVSEDHNSCCRLLLNYQKAVHNPWDVKFRTQTLPAHPAVHLPEPLVYSALRLVFSLWFG